MVPMFVQSARTRGMAGWRHLCRAMRAPLARGLPTECRCSAPKKASASVSAQAQRLLTVWSSLNFQAPPDLPRRDVCEFVPRQHPHLQSPSPAANGPRQADRVASESEASRSRAIYGAARAVLRDASIQIPPPHGQCFPALDCNQSLPDATEGRTVVLRLHVTASKDRRIAARRATAARDRPASVATAPSN